MAEHSVIIIIIIILMWLVTIIIFIRQTIYVKSLEVRLIDTPNKLSVLEGELRTHIQKSRDINDLVDNNFNIAASSFDIIEERFKEARVKSDRIEESLKMLMEV